MIKAFRVSLSTNGESKMENKTPKFVVGDEIIANKALWKITTVYGYSETYGKDNLYAAVRWIKKTQKWSSVSYLKVERNIKSKAPK